MSVKNNSPPSETDTYACQHYERRGRERGQKQNTRPTRRIAIPRTEKMERLDGSLLVQRKIKKNISLLLH